MARLEVGGRTYEEPFERDAKMVTFENIELPTGAVRLAAVLVQEQGITGPPHVVLKNVK